MKKQTTPLVIDSISELHRLLSLPKPEHPLISVINLTDKKPVSDDTLTSIVFNFYSVWMEHSVEGKIRYGQHYFDFDEGTMIFISPGQVVSTIGKHHNATGWGLIIHPDFIRKYPLAKTIRNYGYFSYAVNEALFLSDKEQEMITSIMDNISKEYRANIDRFSQDVMVSQIDLLLNYANRFYNRQFITREPLNDDLLVKMEATFTKYFETDAVMNHGLPSVQYVADLLNVSPNYLSDMLKAITGQTAQQHIHNKLIDKAKELLTTTTSSISEIAYQLGFEHSQSFSRLFKIKTKTSPVQYRRSLN